MNKTTLSLLNNYKDLLTNETDGLRVEEELILLREILEKPKSSGNRATHFYGSFALLGLCLAIVMGVVLYFQGQSSHKLIGELASEKRALMEELSEKHSKLMFTKNQRLRDHKALIIYGLSPDSQGGFSADLELMAEYVSENLDPVMPLESPD